MRIGDIISLGMAAFILVHLHGQYTGGEEEVSSSSDDVVIEQSVDESYAEESYVEEESEVEMAWEAQEREEAEQAAIEESTRIQEEEDEAFAEQRERDAELNALSREIEEELLIEMQNSVAGDPYISDRYELVFVDVKSHLLRLTIDESTVQSLNTDMKATAYESMAQQLQQRYLEYLDEYPDEILVDIADRDGELLARYEKDLFGKNYTLDMNHNNDNNF